jgi:hypothetical protein
MFYEEDRFHPTNNDDDFVYDRAPKKIQPNMLLEHTKPYECVIPIKIGYSKKNVKCFKSGNYIRNAITGIESKDIVGSKMEDLYFKVGIPGVGNFFFDGPDETERHLFFKISDIDKDKWRNKFIAMKEQISKDKRYT